MTSHTEQELQTLQELVRSADEAYNAERISEACAKYQQALFGLNKIVEKDNPDRMQCLRQLAECFTQLQQYPQAQGLWGEVCSILHDTEPMPIEKYIVALFKFTKACERQDNVSQTEDSYNYLLDEADRLLNPAHPLIMSIRQSQSKFFRNQGRVHDAEALDDELSVLAKRTHARAMAKSMKEPGEEEQKPTRTIKDLRSKKAMEWDKDDPFAGPKALLPFLGILILAALVGVIWWMQNHRF